MLEKLKKNYFLLISTFLILYFFFNLLSGQRGLISYFEKKQILNNLQMKHSQLINQIKDLDFKNSLLSDNLDIDYIDQKEIAMLKSRIKCVWCGHKILRPTETYNKKIKQYKLLEIEILINDQTNIETLNKEIQDFIKQSNFKEAAKKFSISPTAKDGGNLGWIDSISLSKEMFSMVDKMKIGEISQPIKKFNTVSFYKVSDIREADKNIDLEKIRKNFINLQKNELFKLYSNSHLSKKKNNTFIELK